MFRAIRKKIFRLIVVSGVGAAAGYFFDKDRGPERRAEARDKANGLLGRAAAGGSWQPRVEHSANGFEPQAVPTPAPMPAPPAPAAAFDGALPGASTIPPAPVPGT